MSRLQVYRLRTLFNSLSGEIDEKLALKSDKGEQIDFSRIKNVPPLGGEFSGTMDDIEDGATYVKTENNFTGDEKAKLGNLSESSGFTQAQILARNLGC